MTYVDTVTEELLSEVVQRVLAAGSPEKIILFGSRARGDGRPDSDLDLLIIESGAEREIKPRYSSALRPLGIPHDLHVDTPESVAAWRNVGNYFLTKVIREGRVLYERPIDRIRESVPPNDHADHARVWFLKGDSDLATARLVLGSDGPYDTACFHAQQAAEKYLKGVIAYYDLDVPRIHSLAELQSMLKAIGREPGLDHAMLETLSKYAVDIRYPKFWPEADQAKRAVENAERIREVARNMLPGGAIPQ